MQELYTSEQALKIDRDSQERFAIPPLSLMEDASCLAVSDHLPILLSFHSILVIAGAGNNGGDALAIARLLYIKGIRTISILLSETYAGLPVGTKETELRGIQRRICEKLGMTFESGSISDILKGKEAVLDGLFGAGLKGAPRKPYDGLIGAVNAAKVKVFSIDVPSGIGDSAPFATENTAIRADETISMGVRKLSLYVPQNRDYAGKVSDILPIFPEGAKPEKPAILIEKFHNQGLPRLKASDYKKTRGSVAIIGGSGRFTGAAAIAAKAAFHMGAGLVTIYTEESLIPVISKAEPSAMISTYDEIHDLGRYDAVLIGPGMGDFHDSVLAMAVSEAKALVIDADGLRAMARTHTVVPEGKPAILTPHLGEFSALVRAFEPETSEACTPQAWLASIHGLCSKVNAVVAVKANTVTVCSPAGGTAFVDGQNPSLGVAGSGDVLAGASVALLARNLIKAADDGLNVMDITEKTAYTAVKVHQEAGFHAQMRLGFYSAKDLIRFIGK